MSDALEITSNLPEIQYESPITEQFPPNYGIFQIEGKPSQSFLQIAQQINKHSCYVISDAGDLINSEPLKLPDYQYKISKDLQMEIDAPLSNDEI